MISTTCTISAWLRNDIKVKWVRSRNCGCLVTWFCYQLIAKPGNKTAAVSWPDPNTLSLSYSNVLSQLFHTTRANSCTDSRFCIHYITTVRGGANHSRNNKTTLWRHDMETLLASWRHDMETLLALPITGCLWGFLFTKGQWYGALIFPPLLAWTNGRQSGFHWCQTPSRSCDDVTISVYSWRVIQEYLALLGDSLKR